MRAVRQRLLPLVTFVLSFVCIHETLAQSQSAPSGAQAFTFDIDAGADMQAATSKQPATALEFTTDGGVPFFNPYVAQHIGSDGKWPFLRKCTTIC